jgi:hypothetical protein
MQPVLKSALVATSALFLGVVFGSTSQARARHYVYPTYAYSIYQNPDGTYESLSDLNCDIRGIPCGIECTREAQARWAHYGYRLPGDGE